MQGSGSIDFFISYTARDWNWASWLDFLLREQGYTTIVQGYDFVIGKSFVHAMDEAVKRCRFVVCLLSPAYLESGWCQKELEAGLHADKLVLLRIADCELVGLAAPYAYANLMDLDEVAARDLTLAQLHKRAGRDPRPKVSPQFPGTPSASPSPRFPTQLPPIWHIPHERNRHFTGRGEILDALHKSLNQGEPAALTQAIKGLGGVGKTQLALEYAYRYASEYDGVWWMRAEEPVTLAQDYAALAGPLGIEQARDQSQMVREVHQALMRRDRFLLIFDNATNPDSLKPYLPTHPGRRIIVTTRANVWPQAALQKVETLELPIAVEFLLNRTGKSDKDAASDIAKRLGCLPLALEQAAAYIEACDKPLSDYSKLLERHGLALLEKYRAQDYGKTVGTTWSMAFEQLQSECPAAADLMHLCAVLAPDAIDVRELAKAKQHLPPRLAKVLGDELQFDETKAALLKYSLIAAGGDSIYVHRLVQEVTRERLSSEQRAEWLTAALRTVNAAFPDNSSDVRTWPACAQWLPHALTLVNAETEADLDSSASARLFNQAGLYLKARADYAAAEPLYRRALEIDEKSHGPNHPAVTIRLNNLANVLRETNRLAEAEPLYRRALEVLEQSLDKEHPHVASPLSNLAGLLRETNRQAEAEPLYRRALEINEKSYGQNHPAVGTALNNLAVLLCATNRQPEAEPLYRRALEIGERSHGPNHPDVAIRLNNLAELLRETNRLAEAEPLYRRALEMLEQSLGEDHPHVAAALSNLALLLRATNRLPKAEPLYRRAFDIEEKRYGQNHPAVARDLNNLAELLRETNRLAEAEPLYRRALDIDEASFGPSHPNVAIRLVNLGSLLRDTDRISEAEPMLQRALSIYQASLGPEHPNTLICRGHLDRLLAAKK